MKKILLLILFILLVPTSTYAQAGDPASSIRFGTADPSSCTDAGANVFYNTTSNILKVCSGGIWTPIYFGGNRAATTGFLLKRGNALLENSIASDDGLGTLTIAGNLVISGGTCTGCGASIAPLVIADANTVEQRNGGAAQRLNIYNTYTNSSNFEQGVIFWNSSKFVIGTSQFGSGTARDFQIWTGGSSRWTFNATTGNMTADADNAQDIGASGANRPRTGYFATSVITPTVQYTSFTVATLPAAVAGKVCYVTDGDAALAWGATVVNSGAGATKYLVWYNGTNWTVAGK